MRFRLDGVDYDLEPEHVRTALRGGAPDGLQDHWVEVDGVRWPPKHALSVATGIQRGDFTSHMALRQFQRLGFPTSHWGGEPTGSRARPSPPTPSPRSLPNAAEPGRLNVTAADSAAAFAMLVGFLSSGLTERISQAEAALDGADGDSAAAIVERFGMTEELLASALLVRQQAGRLNDVVHLAMDDSGRRAQLFVVGARPTKGDVPAGGVSPGRDRVGDHVRGAIV